MLPLEKQFMNSAFSLEAMLKPFDYNNGNFFIVNVCRVHYGLVALVLTNYS